MNILFTDGVTLLCQRVSRIVYLVRQWWSDLNKLFIKSICNSMFITCFLAINIKLNRIRIMCFFVFFLYKMIYLNQQNYIQDSIVEIKDIGNYSINRGKK